MSDELGDTPMAGRNEQERGSGARPEPSPRRADPEEVEIERRWLERARLDSEEFLFFYQKYYGAISSYLFRLVGDDDLTKDLVSQTFFQAMRSLEKFHFRGRTMAGWFYRIATNLYRQLRRSRAYWQYDRECDLDALPGKEAGSLENVIREEERRLILESLDYLDDLSRVIVELQYYEGMTLKQIATVMDMRLGTVKARSSRARHRLETFLRSVLEAEPPDRRTDENPRWRLLDGTVAEPEGDRGKDQSR